MPAAPAAVAPAISPSACIIRVKPVGAMPNGSATRPPSTSREVSTVDTSRRIDGCELHVGERLPGPGQRDLAVGGAVGVYNRLRFSIKDKVNVISGAERAGRVGSGACRFSALVRSGRLLVGIRIPID